MNRVKTSAAGPAPERLGAPLRVLGAVMAISVLSSIAVALAIRPAIIAEFERLERQVVVANVTRVEHMLEVEFRRIVAVTADWALWDETADFVDGRSPDYLASNISVDVLSDLRIDGMVFLDSDDRPVASIRLNPERDAIIRPASDVPEQLAKSPGFTEHPRADHRETAFVTTSDGVVLAASAPITASDRSFPPHGTLVVYRVLDDRFLRTVAQDTHLAVTSDASGTSGHRLPVVEQAAASLRVGGPDAVLRLNDSRIAALHLAADGKGDPAFTFAIWENRPVFRSGMRLANTLALMVIGAGVMLGVATTGLVEVTARRRSAADLEYLAKHDHLTGLPNRRVFEDALERELARALRSGHGGVLLWIDLDDFKKVNDELGHQAGDRLLAEVATRLRATVRTGDEVARIGGDEFVLLLPETGLEEAERIADRLLQALARIGAGISIPGFDVRASIGIVCFPADGDTAHRLLAHADITMYEVKRAGGGAHRVYAAAKDDQAEGN